MQDTTDPQKTTAEMSLIIERIDALEKKVARLQESLQHDHEDLERLQEVAMHDHEDLENLKGSSVARSRYGSRPMVGL